MQDELIVTDKWTFDNDVTSVFDDMLERSIPDYRTMRRLIHDIGLEFASKRVIDIGCSNGTSLKDMISDYHNVRFDLYDISEPMLEKAKELYADNKRVTVNRIDLRNDYPKGSADLVLCILTLQFVPIEYRQKILSRIYESLKRGSALIIVEKVLGETSFLNDILIRQYYDLKSRNGYSIEQIESKRKSLEGVLVPVTSSMNVQFLKSAGFREIECFWRYLNFTGWIAIK